MSANYVAKWNGSSWSGLGFQGDGQVHALAVSGSDLYVGGQFDIAGGPAFDCIAKWNGSSWSPLGGNLNGPVRALAVSGSDIYAGGDFWLSGAFGEDQVEVDNVAKWNGTSWSSLGSGVDGQVFALAVWGSNVYAGGEFTTAGGISANRIAVWDGTSWAAMGSGADAWVLALAASANELYAGGTFTTVGGKVSFGIARATRTTPIQLTGLSFANSAFSFTFTNTPGVAFSAFATTNINLPLSAWTALGSVTEISPGEFKFSDTTASNNVQRFYFVRSP